MKMSGIGSPGSLRTRSGVLFVVLLFRLATLSLLAHDYSIVPGSVVGPATNVMYKASFYEISFTVANYGQLLVPGEYTTTGTYIDFVDIAQPNTRHRAALAARIDGQVRGGESLRRLPPLGGNNRLDANFYFRPPNDLPDGTYRVEVKAYPANDDGGNYSTATDENPANDFAVVVPSVSIGKLPLLDFYRDEDPTNLTFGSPNLIGNEYPTVLNAGDTFQVSALIGNRGNLVEVPPFSIDYYLVPHHRIQGRETTVTYSNGNYDDYGLLNDFLIPESRFIGRKSNINLSLQTQLAIGYVSVTHTLQLPADLNFEDYEIGMIIDGVDQVFERGDAWQGVHLANPFPLPYSLNQRTYRAQTTLRKAGSLGFYPAIRASYVSVRPDLRFVPPLSFSPQSVPAGQFVNFSGVVENGSSQGVTASTVLVHKLVSSPPNSYERTIGTSILGPVAGKTTRAYSATFRIPSGLLGTFSYRAECDHTNLVAERVEFNNAGSSSFATADALTVGPPVWPDLVPIGSPLVSPSTGLPGGTIQVQANFRNDGYSPASNFRVRFVIAANSSSGASERLLGEQVVSASIQAGGSFTLTPTFSLPGANQLPPGQYSITALADSANVIAEINESNNLLALPVGQFNLTIEPNIQLAANLIPSGFTPEKTRYVYGEGFRGTLVVANKGATQSPAASYQIYLSRNSVVGDSDDVLIKSGTHSVVAPGDNISVSVQGVMPTALPGGYRFIMKVDSGAAISESDETDNVRLSDSEISLGPASAADYPELTLDGLFFDPPAVRAGFFMTTHATVGNVGKSGAGGFELEVILSQDGTLGNSDDRLLGKMVFQLLDEGDQAPIEISATLPANLSAGMYRIYWRLDGAQLVPGTPVGGLVRWQELSVEGPAGDIYLYVDSITAAQDIVTAWNTVPGERYYLESSINLTNWTIHPTWLYGDLNGPVSFEAAGKTINMKKRYFRLRNN